MPLPISCHALLQRTASRAGPLLALRVAVLGAAAGGSAWADPNPYYIGASESFTHTTNAFGTADSLQSDNYWSTNLLGGFDQAFGRQRLYGAGNVNYSKYQEQTQLNNTSYGLSTGLDWNTLYQLSGNVSLQANRGLANIVDNANTPINSRNVQKTETASTSVRWGGASLLSVVGALSYGRVRYSAPEYLSSKSSSNSESLGINYNVSPDIRAGIAYRISSGNSPYSIYVNGDVTNPNSYTGNSDDGRNIDLTVDWRTTARTGFAARLSFTRQTNSNAAGLNFSGLTGGFNANYAATGKTSLNASFSREAGSNGSLFNAPVALPLNQDTTPIVPISGLSQNSQVTNVFSVGANYAATSRINANANFQYRHSKLVNTFLVNGVTTSAGDANDDSKSLSVGVSYAAGRNWNVGCNASRSLRNVSGTPDYSYNNNSYGCSAQVTLR